MKRNIIIGLLVLISLFFVVYANIKASKAKMYSELAARNHEEIIKNEEKFNSHLDDFEARFEVLRAELEACRGGE